MQERPVVYNDNKLTFTDLLKLDNSVTIHQRNFQILATEILKVKNSLAPEIMTEVFEIKEPHYNLGSEPSHFKRENAKSAHYSIQSVRHLGPKIWKHDTCPCRFAKTKLLKWVLLDLICIETICFSFSNLFFLIVGVRHII